MFITVMRPNKTPLVFLLLVGLVFQGFPLLADTLSIPQKVMELPKVVGNQGDRAGTWGLPTLIALRYGMTVNETEDDRYDDKLSEQVAVRYLTDLYTEFGDWDLCYYAYLYSPSYVRNLQRRGLSIPQPKPEVKKPAPAKIVEKPKQPKFITYTVKSGDTLSKIAQKHHVKVSDIKKWNNLKSDLIREKQQLKIYQ